MNIILIGMPGSGKSTLGVITAKILGMDFIDTDVLIQKNENKKLQDIINKEGVEAFLDAECRNIVNLKAENSVIATGGSAVLREGAMTHLKENAVTVFLDVPKDEIERRIFNINTRGIAMNRGETVADIFDKRRPYYLRYADLVIETGGITQEEAIAKIVKELEKCKL